MMDIWDEFGIFTDPWMGDFYGINVGKHLQYEDPMAMETTKVLKGAHFGETSNLMQKTYGNFELHFPGHI